MENKRLIKSFLQSLINLFYPEKGCLRCGEERQVNEEYGLCTSCMKKIDEQRVFPPTQAVRKPLQKHEFLQGHRFERVISPFEFGGEIKNMIYSLKRSGHRYLARPMGLYMARALTSANLSVDMCVFVPMFIKQLKVQGFNHAEILCDEISRILKTPKISALSRLKDTSVQKTLGKKERRENVKGAFCLVVDKKEIHGKRILLVDDVLTTGATADACARILLRAGAEKVYILAAAITRIKSDSA